MISYDDYRVFCCVVEHGNITAAGNALFLAQSTVSRTVQRLEHQLHCALLERTAKGGVLTEEGRLLYRHLKAAFTEIHQAEKELDHLLQHKSHILRIGASELTLTFLLPPFLERFKQEYPNTTLQISYTTPPAAAQMLKDGHLDVAVLASPMTQCEEIELIPLMEIEYVLVAGAGFPELHHTIQDLGAILRYPLVTMEQKTSVRTYTEQLLRTVTNISKWRAVCEVGSMPLLISMVERNLGLSFLPELHVQNAISRGTLFPIQLSRQLPVEHVFLMFNRETAISPAEKRFIQILQE